MVVRNDGEVMQATWDALDTIDSIRILVSLYGRSRIAFWMTEAVFSLPLGRAFGCSVGW